MRINMQLMREMNSSVVYFRNIDLYTHASGRRSPCLDKQKVVFVMESVIMGRSFRHK